jgi:hypothetical protein
MAVDPYPYRDENATAGGLDAAAVTANDTTVLPLTRGVYVGGTGDLAVRMSSGNSVTFKSVPAGALLPIRVDQVKATGTTATNIVAIS